MFLLRGPGEAEAIPSSAGVVLSASDLVLAATCEYAVLRRLDVRLGRLDAVPVDDDPLLERTARLGDAHEARVLAGYEARFGMGAPGVPGGVVEITPARTTSRTGLLAAHAATLTAMTGGADVVYQGSFFDGRFHGRADFLVREAPGVYAVYDTKLARHAKIPALLQLAAYADQLERAGLTVASSVHLILGDGAVSSHRTLDLLPVYRERRARLEHLVDEHLALEGPVEWLRADIGVCGRCEHCVEQVEATRDVLLVAGMRLGQRAALREAGIDTIDELAAGEGPVPGIGPTTLAGLRAQARLQVAGPVTAPGEGPGEGPGTASGTASAAGPVPRFELFAPEALAALPPPDEGDLFFDFEGDPLWADGALQDWGLEYLFGVVEAEDRAKPGYVAFWAHDRAQERMALRDFLDHVAERRSRYPGLHVYHYAAYEKSALLRLAARHAEGETEVDDLLRAGVLVDLYPIVRSSVRISEASYSIKKLEPLYMGEELRGGEVTTAGDSIVEYAAACRAREEGDETGWRTRLDAIADYNAYDCVSTLRLRDWLLERAAEHGVLPLHARPEERVAPELTEADAEEELLRARLSLASGPADPGGRTPDQQAVAMVAAALGYHRREDKPVWWSHFDRLNAPLDDWADTRNTLRPTAVEQVTDWVLPTPRSTALRRMLRMRGVLEEGTDLRPGASVVTVYDPPVPPAAKTSGTGLRGWVQNAAVVDVVPVEEAGADGGPEATPGEVWVDVREATPAHGEGWAELPIALGPGSPLPTQLQRTALRRLGDAVAQALELPGPVIWPSNPALDLCRRRPPRLKRSLASGTALPRPALGEDDVATVTRAVRALDRSYLAVQGPPGTGKTYLGGHVIAALVADGWRIGVVAQSHAVVENLLRSAHRAGVPADAIGKKARSGQTTTGADDVPPWQWLDQQAEVAAFQRRRMGLGWVFGGTAWDFANPRRFPDGGLDLLVIDEAGQFSLANTLAVSWPALRLLLLGDPQQLPQVSQGMHPEPVDVSALGWLAEGHDTLPPERGYFLERTWRMHPELTRTVSRLAYEDRLSAMPVAAERSLAGIAPGVHPVTVEHRGRSIVSPEEADAVVRLVTDLLGRSWTSGPDATPRPLTSADVLVVAAYNAQVALIGRMLADAGFGDVAVGTVDRFQGREAAVVIVSMAASSADEVPRGAAFLLSRNRINVAISRGQWAAYVVRSPRLTAHLPLRPAELADLGAFVAVCGG